MTTLKRFQRWYEVHCDGDWEHEEGVLIATLDNPGWQVRISLRDTESYAAIVENNKLTNVSDATKRINAKTNRAVGLEKPLTFRCGAMRSS